MFELTNDQRKCFALVPINEKWECVEVKPSPYDDFKTYVFIQENTIVKCVLSGDNYYSEYEMNEQVSADRKFLLPKTSKGKPVLLTSPSILKRKGLGMCLKKPCNLLYQASFLLQFLHAPDSELHLNYQ